MLGEILCPCMLRPLSIVRAVFQFDRRVGVRVYVFVFFSFSLSRVYSLLSLIRAHELSELFWFCSPFLWVCFCSLTQW